MKTSSCCCDAVPATRTPWCAAPAPAPVPAAAPPVPAPAVPVEVRELGSGAILRRSNRIEVEASGFAEPPPLGDVVGVLPLTEGLPSLALRVVRATQPPNAGWWEVELEPVTDPAFTAVDTNGEVVTLAIVLYPDAPRPG